MPRRARRDPQVSGPVDGDYALDKVHGVEAGRRAFLASDEDLPALLGDGAVIERRREGGPKPSLDLGGDVGEVVKVRNLTLVTMDEKSVARRHARSQSDADQTQLLLRQEALDSGGEYNARAQSGPVSPV